MGFPAQTQDGSIVEIVEKSTDEHGTELFTDQQGKVWTRGFANGGNDATSLFEYDAEKAAAKHDLSDAEPDPTNSGISQAQVDSETKSAAVAAAAERTGTDEATLAYGEEATAEAAETAQYVQPEQGEAEEKVEGDRDEFLRSSGENHGNADEFFASSGQPAAAETQTNNDADDDGA